MPLKEQKRTIQARGVAVKNQLEMGKKRELFMAATGLKGVIIFDKLISYYLFLLWQLGVFD